VDGQPFVLRGKLSQQDWGAFTACGSVLTLRFRNLLNTRSTAGPSIRNFREEPAVELQGRRTIYFGVGSWRGREVPAAKAEDAIADINKRRSAIDTPTVWSAPPAGWGWEDRRELYYGKGSKCALAKSEQCP